MSPTTRRTLLQSTTLLAASAALPALAADAPSPANKRRPMKKGLYANIKADTILDKFKLLKEAGFTGLEIDAPGTDVAQVVEACKQTGIEIEGVVDSAHWRQHLSDPSASIREAGVKALQQALRDCKAMNGSSVLLVPGVCNEKVSYEDAYKRSQEEIRKALPLAAELGVKIAIENVWNNFHLSPLEAARYVDEFESPMVGWHFDIGNIMHFGFPEQWIRTLGKRIVKIHIKEYDRKKSDKEGKWAGFKTELTEGSNNWSAIMKALDEIGYNTANHWATIEMGGGDLARLKTLSAQLDKILES